MSPREFGREELMYAEAVAHGFETYPELTTSQWADQYRWLASGTGPDPGKYATDTTPYLREIMDVMSPQHPARRIVVMKAARLGFTEALNNLVGRTIHLDRRSIIFYNPSIPKRRDAKRGRIDPMVSETPVLEQIIRREKRSGGTNTLDTMTYPGGRLLMLHASSANQFRAEGAPIVICDEIDGWIPYSCSDGDKIRLAEKRASNYEHPKIVLGSTPTERDISPVEREFLRSDQRRFHVLCPSCGREDYITWSGFRDYVRKSDGGHFEMKFETPIPKSAVAYCPECKAEIPETHKYHWLREGRWLPTAEGDGETVGFHLPAMLAPYGWQSWLDLAKEFVEVHEKMDELRQFVNTRLGETFENRRDKLDANTLEQRPEHYGADVPDGVGAIVYGVDTQDDRLEVPVFGFGAHEEVWVLAWLQCQGDPSKPGVWQQLEEARLMPWRHVSGRTLRCSAVGVDTKGHKTEGAYRYCKAHEDDHVYALHGTKQVGLPVVGVPSRRNAYRVPLYPVCTDTAKARIFERLGAERPGPGYVHLPDSLPDLHEFVLQLAGSEKALWKRDARGRSHREWYQLRPDNHMLDGFVYALTALYIRGPAFIRTLADRARKFAVRVEPAPGDTDPLSPRPEPPPLIVKDRTRARRRRGFVHNWK